MNVLLTKQWSMQEVVPVLPSGPYFFCWAWENPVMIFEITLSLHSELEIILNLYELEIFLFFP
jgi:hypothetical protein